ncbi:hypothetical protein AAVH_29656 [Aphelenchoides avenae]|nr:hypothetical protein AAVH_29656 [Aphelenchus avenae]
MRSIVEDASFAELAEDGLLDDVSQWLKALENTNRFLTTEGQELVGRSDYGTLEQVLDSVVVPVEAFDKPTRDNWSVRLWSLRVHVGYHSMDNELLDHLVEGLEFSGKRYLRSNDRPRALERFQQALQIFEISESGRRFASALYIALTLRPSQRLSDHLHEQYTSTAGVLDVMDLMDVYYADERDRFYELMGKAQALPLDAFIAERLAVHCATLRARICSRPIQLPAETWEIALSMLRSDRVSVQNTCKKFRETFAKVFLAPRS